MDARTLEALKGSIEKWRLIVEEGGEDRGYLNCPLCERFNTGFGCGGCPVAVRTEHYFCDGSPFQEWERLKKGFTGCADTPEKLDAARAELAFLRSLLPEEEREQNTK